MTPDALLASVRKRLTGAADHSLYLYVGNVTGASLTVRHPDPRDCVSIRLALPTYEPDGDDDFEYTTSDTIADIQANRLSYEALEAAMRALASGDVDACAKAEACLQEDLNEIGSSIFSRACP